MQGIPREPHKAEILRISALPGKARRAFHRLGCLSLPPNAFGANPAAWRPAKSRAGRQQPTCSRGRSKPEFLSGEIVIPKKRSPFQLKNPLSLAYTKSSACLQRENS